MYLRKAFSFGPIRLNLSRSGLGASFGITGARIGVGPRGTYVHAGRGGLYYRQFLGTSPRSSLRVASPLPPPAHQEGALQEIESADISQLVDSSSAELLQELNRVQSRTQVAPLVFIGSILVLTGLAAAQLPAWSIGVAAALLVIASVYARHVDVTRGTAVLRYELDAEAATSFERLKEGFSQLVACDTIWHIEAAGGTQDWKRNAGATTLMRRQAVRPIFSRPPRMECNLEVPTLPVGVQTLYFFPDRILIYHHSRIGSVQYSDLAIETGKTRFIEEGALPRDAQVVDRTWKYVNKKGGPDRRFSNNRELPIVAYGILHLTSKTGLNEMLHCSSADSVASFAAAMPHPAGGTTQ